MGRGRAPCCDKSKVRTGPWSPAEDLKLMNFIQIHGHTNWRALPKQAGLVRCGKSCRLRWMNYLRPDLKRGKLTAEEENTIIQLHNSVGNKWSKIASCLPGRTDNEIKNVWNTHLKKRLVTTKSEVDCHNKAVAKQNPTATCLASSSCGSSSITTSADENAEKLTDDDQDQRNRVKEKPDFSDVSKPDYDADFWEMLDPLPSGGDQQMMVKANEEYQEMSLDPQISTAFDYYSSVWDSSSPHYHDI